MIDALNAYLREVRNAPFVWGKHDCFTFTNEAFRRMTGAGWADDWLPRYVEKGRVLNRAELVREFGFDTFEQAADARLTRAGGVPPRGALITTAIVPRFRTGVALGVCVGTRGAFLDTSGLTFLPIEAINGAWIK